jgi:hypothetical protein
MRNIAVAASHIEKPGESQPRETVPPRIAGCRGQAIVEKEPPQRFVTRLGNIDGAARA